MKIFINPGHCIGLDSGACGNGLKEAEVAMAIGKKVQTRLKSFGLTTKLFQYDGLAEIVDESNAWDADLFVSIHCNAANGYARGTETFTTGSAEGTKLATAIQNQMLKRIPSTVDRGVKTANFYVIKYTNCPAVLVETAFIDNATDAKLLIEHEDDFAEAIADGVLDYLGMTTSLPAPDVIDTPSESPINFDTDIETIAILARKYESNGDPACVANNAGDLGGISYGLYQFSSKVGVVDAFVKWLCNYPDKALANYGKVLAQYKVNSNNFIRKWKELGTIDAGNFGKLQDEYIKAQYYDVAAKKLSDKYFNLNKHTDALKAVVLSRAIQNGASGCTTLFEIAVKKMSYPNLSYVDDSYFDKDIINAVYDYLIVECDLSAPDHDGVWRSPDNFCHGSKNIILALRSRFIRERADALALLAGNFNI